MGWVDSPKFFCAFSETLKAFTNDLLDTELPVPAYEAISKILITGTGPRTHARASPILNAIWMTSSPWYRVVQKSNTESLKAKSVLLSDFSPRCRDIPKTR